MNKKTTTQQSFKRFAIGAGLFLLMQILTFANPIATYYGKGNYPAWTDRIHWEREINMKTYDFSACADCNTEFKKFEYARDVLYNQGGGVLHYPAGNYDFTNIPSSVSDSAQGRGLMLKKGVVILGEAPSVKNNAVHDTLVLLTKFNFKTNTKKDIDNVDRKVPVRWNIIGCIPANAETLKDVNDVGIAWVHVDYGVVYFGFEFTTTATYTNTTAWYGKYTSKGVWKNRVPDCTHPIDAYCAYGNGNTFLGAGDGRFVFGCVFENSTINNDNIIDFSQTGTFGYYPFKFGARIGVYGANVFIANNLAPKPTGCFKYRQRTCKTKQTDGCGTCPSGSHDTIVIFDYAKNFGLDVNKSSLNNFTNKATGYYLDGVIVNENKIYNHGSKGFELSGEWVTIRKTTTLEITYTKRVTSITLTQLHGS